MRGSAQQTPTCALPRSLLASAAKNVAQREEKSWSQAEKKARREGEEREREGRASNQEKRLRVREREGRKGKRGRGREGVIKRGKAKGEDGATARQAASIP